VVAFVASLIVAILMIGLVFWYGRRRPVGAPLTWGEAILAAVYSFFLMFWVYGVVPHQWLTWAGNELGWRTDKIVEGYHLWFTGKEGIVQYFLPFGLDYEKIRDILVSLIYVVFLGLHVAMWSMWQARGKEKPAAIATSTYGRPLVRRAG
jgi:hypothetical protein